MPNESDEARALPGPADDGHDLTVELEAIVTRAVERASYRIQHSGPLPHPSLMEEYERLIPGSAARMLEVAEEDNRHRRALELRVVNDEAGAVRRGQFFGFAIAMTSILGGTALAATGSDTAGLGAIITALAALTTAFVVGQRKRDSPPK